MGWVCWEGYKNYNNTDTDEGVELLSYVRNVFYLRLIHPLLRHVKNSTYTPLNSFHCRPSASVGGNPLKLFGGLRIWHFHKSNCKILKKIFEVAIRMFGWLSPQAFSYVPRLLTKFNCCIPGNRTIKPLPLTLYCTNLIYSILQYQLIIRIAYQVLKLNAYCAETTQFNA